ncbi:MAG: DUF11 domain-containing protein, partial [Verrucomicrobiota bacterium]
NNGFGGAFEFICTTPLPVGVGSITNDPLFVSTNAFNYRLESNSPCIHAGTNTVIAGAVDLDGSNRISGLFVDLGAYENPMGVVSADLLLIKTVNPASLSVGSNLVYTLVVSNRGPQTAVGMIVTDTLPAEVVFVQSFPAPDQVAGGVLVYNIGSLNAGLSLHLTITGAVNAAAMNPLTNIAVVTTLANDTNLADNVDMAVTTLPDFDNDGMKDFVDPDDDNDEVPDEDEAVADTDPFDASSLLWLRIDRTSTQTVQTLTFPTSGNRQYFIQSRTNLLSDIWTTPQTNISGTGGLLVIPQTNEASDVKYFRVGVEFP